MIYYKIDLTHSKAQMALDNLSGQFANQIPSNQFSVNTGASAAWAKLAEAASLSNPWQAAIIDSESGSNTKAAADIYGGGW